MNEAQRAVLADNTHPANVQGFAEVVASMFLDSAKVEQAFRTGEGIGWHEHHKCLFSGTERFFRPGVVRPVRVSGATIDRQLQLSTMAFVLGLVLIFLIGWGAGGIGFGILGGKLLEGSARQPDLGPMLLGRFCVVAAFVDAVAMIGIGFALFFTFANPFLSGLTG